MQLTEDHCGEPEQTVEGWQGGPDSPAELLEPFISRDRRVSGRHLTPSPAARMSPYRDCERDPVTPSLGDPIHPRRLHGLCGGNIGAIIVLWPSQVAPSLIRRRAEGRDGRETACWSEVRDKQFQAVISNLT